MRAKWWMALCLVFLVNVLVAGTPINQSNKNKANKINKVNKIVIFGDSLSDTGNLYEYMRHQLPMSPPYHEGRFSDGAVWIEHVLSHYFPENTKSHMINYAFGGSSVGSEDEDDEEDDITDGAMLNLDSEISSYLLAHDDKADISSLYVIWMGSNNYLSLPENLDDEVEFTLSGIRRGLERLLEKGAKQVMVVGVPDLGKIPMAREFEFSEELTYLSKQHNLRLKEEVDALRVRYPDVRWVFYDVDALFTEALTHPETYGFKNVTGTCYDTLDYVPSNHSILTMASRIKPRTQAENSCDTYLFFDPVHPSGRAHAYIAEEGINILNEAGIQFTG